MIGSVLLVIPGIIFALVTAFSIHLVAYEDAGIGDAIKGSIDIVKRNVVNVLLLFIVLGIVNAIGQAVVVGVFLALPISLIASAVAYEQLKG